MSRRDHRQHHKHELGGEYFAIDGRVMPAAKARISVLDLGFLRGVGAFETLATYGGHPHAVSAHLERLWQTAEKFGIAPCFTERDLRRVIGQIGSRNPGLELRINIVVTPGELSGGVFGASRPTWVVIAREQHPPAEAAYTQGVSVVTCHAERVWPDHKTTAYLMGWPGVAAATAAGAAEALYVSSDDAVREGVTSNVMALFGRTIVTPAADILPGLTRAGIEPLALSHGLEWHERTLRREELLRADEVWITSTVRELLPVVKVDGHAIAGGVVGPWATTLRAAYHARALAQAAGDAAAHAAAQAAERAVRAAEHAAQAAARVARDAARTARDAARAAEDAERIALQTERATQADKARPKLT